MLGPARQFAITSALFSAALGPACKCGSAAVLSKAPQIDASPAAVLFQPLPVGHSALVTVEIRNVGNQDLHLARDPWVAAVNGLVEFTLPSKLERDCTGALRSGDLRLTIVPGDCARVAVRYAPVQGGDGKAQLNLASDDPARPVLGVPISLGAPPRLAVCAVKADGSDDACDSADGTPPKIEFGLVAKGQSALRKVRLKNLGTSKLDAISVRDPSGPMAAEFARSQSTPVSIEPGQSADVAVRFAPVGGGPRTAFLEVDSADPVRPAVQVPLRGIAEGPALCADPSPLDYGQVNLGQQVEKQLVLSSCGTVPVQLRQAQFDALSSPSFSAPSLPAPQTLQPGAKISFAVRFLAQDSGDATGALLVPNDGQPDQYVALHGSAKVAPACRLEASVSGLDFGQVVRGQTADRALTVANRGQLVCNLSKVSVSSGGAYFSVLQPPTTTIQLRPGDAFTSTFRYAPTANDANVSDAGTAELASDDPLHPQLDVALTGAAVAAAECKLSVTPGAVFGERVLQFGNVVVGRTKVLPVTFRNVGSANCSLQKLRFVSLTSLPPPLPSGCASDSSCGEYKLLSPSSVSLAPGQSAMVQVQFKPTSTNQIPILPSVYLFANTSDQSIQSECTMTARADSSPGCVQVGLEGQGDISNLEVIPADLDFGLITLGCRAKQSTVTLYNTGASTSFNVKSIALDPTTAPFFVSAPPTPFVMKPGQRVPLQVTYKPSQAAKETASLRIESDASNTTSNNPYVTVSLSGTGTTDKHQRDTFSQATVPKVDMLFVIDDSGSFDFYQKQLAGQAGKFITAALKYNADFHLGVSTNDVVQQKSDSNASYSTDIFPGGLYGQPAVVTNSTPDAQGAFSKNVRVGTGGTAQREAGLELAWDVLRAPFNQKPAPQGSQGFLRDDARLIVIDVQDDDDESNGTTAFYIDFFKSLKGQYNAGMVSFNAIGAFDDHGQPSDCAGNREPAGVRYKEVADATGGKTWSVCSADWGAIADQLSLGAFSGRSQFPLTRSADPATIVVTLNGAPQAAGADYTFDQPSNSIVFAKVPPAGATIVVDYDALCF